MRGNFRPPCLRLVCGLLIRPYFVNTDSAESCSAKRMQRVDVQVLASTSRERSFASLIHYLTGHRGFLSTRTCQCCVFRCCVFQCCCCVDMGGALLCLSVTKGVNEWCDCCGLSLVHVEGEQSSRIAVKHLRSWIC